MKIIENIFRSANAFKNDSEIIFSTHESSKFRILTIEQTKSKLVNLSIMQEKLFSESIGCVENCFYKSAIVLSWAAFIDFLENKLESDSLVKVHTARPNWIKFKSMEYIKENISEYQIIEVARDTKLLTKAECKTIHGLLSKRNECAHPTPFEPGLNDCLGYISELLNRLEIISARAF